MPRIRTHTPAHSARRLELARDRARRWRERHAADLAALQARVEVASIDAAVVAALIDRHVQARGVTGEREPALPLVDVIRVARERLQADGMDPDAAKEAVRKRLSVLAPPDPAEFVAAAA